MEFNREDIRKLIFFLWKEGCYPPEAEKRINTVLGEGTISAIVGCRINSRMKMSNTRTHLWPASQHVSK